VTSTSRFGTKWVSSVVRVVAVNEPHVVLASSDAVLDEQLLNAQFVGEELIRPTVDVDIGDRGPDQRRRDVDVRTRVQHGRYVDRVGNSREETTAITHELVLRLPELPGSIKHAARLCARRHCEQRQTIGTGSLVEVGAGASDCSG
jgi:hypothetical protein